LIERFSPRGRLAAMHIEAITASDIAWQKQALCAQTGADFFFPEPGSSVREAKRICGLCEIRSACLEYALIHDERFGVWGGLSEKERMQLRRVEDGRAVLGAVQRRGEGVAGAGRPGRVRGDITKSSATACS
jgi:WhiB family redox-sensing transcriptional regulator